jgi:hypothetical protein
MTSWDISWRTEGSRVSKYGAQADEVLQIAATPRPGLGLVRRLTPMPEPGRVSIVVADAGSRVTPSPALTI